MIPRRSLLMGGPLALAACGRAEANYFGKTDPPRRQRLVYLLAVEPPTLDPAKSNNLWEAPIIHGKFDGLAGFHPATGEPVAALATQQQCRRNLGVDVKLVGHDFPTFLQIANNLRYEAISGSWDCGRNTDPNWFLAQFQTGSMMSGTGWSDPRYDVELALANATVDPAGRMTRLAACERHLLAAMPVIPLYSDTWSYLHKPYVRGGLGNLLNIRQFKYAWIDTKWKPS